MISRAAAASLAKWALPPTASSRSVKRSISSGNRSRLAWRRCFKSARPVAKSKLLNAASRRLRRPVIAWMSARSSLGSSRALLTRREKWRRDSGTRVACFLDRLAERSWCRHRRQAYGPDAHPGALERVGLDHGVRMREHRGASQPGIAGAHLDPVPQPVEGPREYRRHEAVLAWEGCHRLERAAGAGDIGLFGITHQLVQLHQSHGRDRVLRERLDALAQTAELVRPGVVEVAAELRIRVAILEVPGDIASPRQPVTAQAGLVRANRRPQPPHLVRQLPGHAFRVLEASARLVAVREQALQH